MERTKTAFEPSLDFHTEERTFEFGEEEPSDSPIASNQFSMLKDYGGEDFSRYMNDDDGVELEVSSQAEPNREEYVTYDTIPDILIDNFQQTNDTTRSHRTAAKEFKSDKFKRLMAHVSKATKTNRTKKQLPGQEENSIKIYNFSFADSKMGYSFAASIQEKQHTSETLEENADSGIGVGSNSDIQDLIKELPGFQKSSWWSLGTLSSRLTSTPDAVSPLKRHSSSSPSIVDPQQPNFANKCRNKTTVNVGRMWKKVTNTITGTRKPDLSIKTEEIHF